MKKLLFFVTALVAANLSQAQWEPDVRLTNNPDSSLTSYPGERSIAAIDDFVHAVWWDKRDGNFEIYYKRSTDEGTSWEPDVRLTNDDYRSSTPSIAVSAANVHVVWQDFRDGIGNREIYYKRSTDEGMSWGADTRLTFDPALSNSPSVSVSGSVVHVIWQDFRDYPFTGEIYYKRSTDGGISWEPEVRLTNDVFSSYNSSIATSGATVHVVWNDTRVGSTEIFYKRSIDGGVNWEVDTQLTTKDMMYSGFPSIAVSGSAVHITWTDTREGWYEIYYKRSLDEGISWDNGIRLTSGDYSISWFSNITVSGQVVHVVWEDTREGNYHIYYKRSNDGGDNWGEDTQISGNGVMSSKRPFVSVSGPVVHTVWFDDRDGNFEIYYKRDPTGNIIVGTDNMLLGNSEQPFTIYPNLASTILNISFSSPSTEMITLRFMDMSGKTIKMYNLIAVKGMNQYTIDLYDFRNGLYFIGLTDGTKRIFRKVIINK